MCVHSGQDFTKSEIEQMKPVFVTQNYDSLRKKYAKVLQRVETFLPNCTVAALFIWN